MNDNEILILRPLYKMKDHVAIDVRLDIKEQLRRGKVITIPFGWEAVTKPSDEEVSTPWDFIDNSNYSPFDSQGKERLIFCTKCGISIEHYDAQYQYCPYCGKRHYFDKVEDKKEPQEDEEIWCTECPYFKSTEDAWNRDWFGALCTKDGHKSSPSMYAIQSLHNYCPLKIEKPRGDKSE